MNAAILCPGPSLASLRDVPVADVVIAVNRAAWLYTANIWATLDLPFIREGRANVKGSPSLFTRAEYRHEWEGALLTVERLAEYFPDVKQIAQFTTPAAMILAGWIGATTLTMYGCDMAGAGGIDRPSCEGRNESRWIRERPLYQRAVDFLSERNVTVTRWIPE